MIDDFILGLAALAFGFVLVVMGLPSRSRTWHRRIRPDDDPGPEPDMHKATRLLRLTLATLAVLTGAAIGLAGLTVASAALYGVDVQIPLRGWLNQV